MTNRRLAILGLAVGIAVAFGTLGTPNAEAADKDCPDFSTQKQAQEFLEKHGTEEDPHGIDGTDNDGVACESLACPCKKPSLLTRLPDETLDFLEK